MTNQELEVKLNQLIREERKITNEILNLINLSVDRRLYLELGFSSMFDWLTKGFGYSHSAAFRRIEAAKLLRVVPEVSGKLETGEVSLSSLSKTQTLIKAQEKATGVKMSVEKKKEIVQKIENKSTKETEQILFEVLPAAAVTINQDRKVVINENQTRHMMTLENKVSSDLARAKEVLSHKFPDAKDADVIAYALKFMLDRMDPLRVSGRPKDSLEVKKDRLEKSKRLAGLEERGGLKVISKAELRREIFKSSDAKCTYKNPKTGHVCGSTYQVQIDHMMPKAIGGGDEKENLRLLCRQHNFMMGERVLGKEKMNQWRN